MCAGIGQDVVLSISSGWCDVGGGWNAGYSLCVILYSMMVLEYWRRCCSVGGSFYTNRVCCVHVLFSPF